MATSLKDRLSKALIENKLITPEKLEEALNIQKENGGKLSEILVEKGFIDKRDLMVALSDELGIPPINLGKYKIDPEVIKLIPKKTAQHYKIIPVSKIGNVLTIAMADPLNIFAIDDIKSLTGFSIGPVITTDKDIEDAYDTYYGETTHKEIEDIVSDMADDASLETVEEKYDSGTTEELMKLVQDTPVVKMTNLILSEAVKAKASDILIEPLETKLRIRYRVDGILQEGNNPPKSMHNGIISRIKVMSELDIAERRLPQDGRFKIRILNKEVDFRVSVLPSSFGEKIALRILDKTQATLDLDKLGFEPKPLEDLKKVATRPHGMILICGPTGCGKTTTLYSILKNIDTPEKNIITIEDPVEYLLYGINQVSIKPEIGLTFASSLRSILRQDPDVIMVGEIRDFDTVDIAIKAALTGHLVLSTLHTTTAIGSIVRLVNMGVEPFLLTSSVLLVAAQRLVRKLCPACKEPYKVDSVTCNKYKIKCPPGGVTLFRPKGCPNCFNTGYRGRAGLIEVLVLTPQIRELIANKAQEYELREAARVEGMATLRENGITKVLEGVTSLEEILRLTVGEQEAVIV